MNLFKKNLAYAGTFAAAVFFASGSIGYGQPQQPYDQPAPPPYYNQQQPNYPQQQNYPQQPTYQQPNYPQGQYGQPTNQQPYYNQGQQPYYNQPAPAVLSPQQLDSLAGRVALYPDPLLAQVLTASTFWNEIPEAAAWANEHAALSAEGSARAMREDRLPWDPSVLALLPFPNVLNQMANDMGWTQQLGNAVLTERNQVMDSVQHMRQVSASYGYLQSNSYDRVVNNGAGDIEIQPVNPGYIYVPTYDPYVVYSRPRPGFFVGGAVRFGSGITIGTYAPLGIGWSSPTFGWRSHEIFFDNHRWDRSWSNRNVYVHPYEGRVRFEGPRVERHEFHEFREHDRR